VLAALEVAMPELAEVLRTLTGKARRLLAKNGEVGEENTKALLVEPMLQALRWDTHDLDEVKREFRYNPQDNPVDYALFVSGKPRLFVEAKSLGRDLGQRKWKTQAVNYANTAGVEWCVLTDGNFWQVYKSNAPGDLDQKLFLETWLHNPEGRTPPYEPQYVLALLAREKLAENAIERLWQVLNVDRRGRAALLDMVDTKNPSLVRLIRKWSDLTRKEVEAFLDRAEVSVETPPVPVTPVEARQTERKVAKGKRRGRRGREPRVPGLPTQRELEIPLLRAILKRGGSVNVRAEGRQIGEELANEYGLTQEQRTTTFPDRPESVWSNRIRWTRMSLVQKGDLDGSRRGVWRVTEQGRRRVSESRV
jgi:hypothetical protein